MKVLILGGFLGSGKTTALMQLARHIVDNSKSEAENKVIILENEVGEVGIDDMYLRSGGLQVSNLFSGCACCTVSGELIGSLTAIKETYDPDWVIVETTGIAYPGRIQESLKWGLDLDSSVAVVVDAKRWKRLRIPLHELLQGQIVNSAAVLINKCDLVDEQAVDEVERDIRELDENTKIYRISALEPVPAQVWNGVLGEEL